MASFDGESDDRELVKYSLKRVEPIVRRFIKVLHIDLGRLHKHKQNIERFQEFYDAAQLNKEQINANTTVQQINGTLRQLECTRTQIKDEDLKNYDSQVKEIYQEAITAVVDFTSFRSDNSHQSTSREPLSELKPCSLPNEHYLPEAEKEADCVASSVPVQSILGDQQLQLEVEPTVDQASEESWQELQGSLQELNGLIHDYVSVVESQQGKVDRIEDNIENAQENVSDGTKSLSKAGKIKAALFPVAGAVIGGALGGPIGLMAGIKLGGLAAVSGGIIGFTGGRFLKKRQQKVADMELVNLSKQGSQSLPELSSADKELVMSRSRIGSDAVT